jgi:hypothetical protein
MRRKEEETMLDYDNEARLLLAREHAESLAEEMRRSRRLTPDVAGFPARTRLRELLRRAAHFGRANEPESSIPVYDA